MAEVHAAASAAIRDRFGRDPDLPARLLGIWVEPDGRVVLHLNSVETASVVTHALWLHYQVDSAIHPEHGVLVWTA
jgi:hypothetical protein